MIPVMNGAQQKVRVEIIDVRGRLVGKVFEGVLPDGRNVVEWTAMERSGKPVAPGVYFVSLRAGDMRESERVVIVH
jgi:hypothetical protein